MVRVQSMVPDSGAPDRLKPELQTRLLLELRHRVFHFGKMRVGIRMVGDVGDLALFVDQETDPAGERLADHLRAVGVGDFHIF